MELDQLYRLMFSIIRICFYFMKILEILLSSQYQWAMRISWVWWKMNRKLLFTFNVWSVARLILCGLNREKKTDPPIKTFIKWNIFNSFFFSFQHSIAYFRWTGGRTKKFPIGWIPFVLYNENKNVYKNWRKQRLDRIPFCVCTKMNDRV